MAITVTLRGTKGAALTHNELDANFSAIKTAVDDLQAASPGGLVETHHGGTGLSAVVGAYAAIRGNSGGTAYEGATIEGTSNRVTVSTATPNKWIISTPQDLHTGASPTFTSASVGSISVTNTTSSTSTTTGAIIVSGGGGFAGSVNCVLFSVTGTSSTDLPTYGSEFLTGTGWTSTGWTGDFATGWTHTPGNTSVLSQSTAAVVGTKYQIELTITGRTAGSVTLAFGGQSLSSISAATSFGPTATTVDSLTLTPTSDFDGKIVASIKAITAAAAYVQSWLDRSGNVKSVMRITSANYNTYLGANAGSYNTSGTGNTGVGYASLRYLTTGTGNTALGVNSLSALTVGTNNASFGTNTLTAVTTAYNNSGCGSNALMELTTGYNNSSLGYNTGRGITTGTGNTIVGAGITGLAAGLTNNIILASGNTNRMSFDGTDWSIPSTTEATSHTAASVKIAGGLSVVKRICSPKMFITEEGGFAIRLTAGESLNRGEIVACPISGGADGKVWKAATTEMMPVGIVFQNSSADAEVVVIVSGIAYVLPESGITAARGNVLLTSTSAAGRASQSSAPNTTEHWRECGHWLDQGSGNGAITRAILHFN